MKRLRASASIILTITCVLTLFAGIASATSSNKGAIRNGGQLTITDVGLAWSSLDPQAVSGTTGTSPAYSPMFEGLFTFNVAGNKLEPQLATSYSISKDRLNVTIYLQHGVKFQDGTPFNASAVVSDIERMANPSINSQCVPYFTTLSSVIADNTYKVTLNFSVPYGALMDVLGGVTCSRMVSPTAVQAEGSSGFGADPVGTGPYKFTSEVLDSSILWQKWPGYWNKSQAGHFSSIALNSVGSDQSCLAAVEAGTAQVCAGGNAADALTVKHVKSVVTYKGIAPAVGDIAFNQSAPPFDNIWARKAVIQAINVPLVLKTLFGAQVTATENYLPSSSWAWTGNRVRGYPQYSIAQARADVAKLPGGSLTFTMLEQNTPGYIDFGEAVQSELAAAGINMQIEPLQTSTLYADTKAGHFESFQTQNAEFPDPDVDLYFQFDSNSPNDENRINVPAINQLAVEGRETVSQPQRRAIYVRLVQALAQDAAQAELYSVPTYYFLARRLQGFGDVGDGWLTYSTMYMS